jgi:hypothetical protein
MHIMHPINQVEPCSEIGTQLQNSIYVYRNLLNSLAQIFSFYEGLKYFSGQLNNWLGHSTFALTVGSLPYFVSRFLIFVEPPDVLDLLCNFNNFLIMFSFVILAAIVDKKVNVIHLDSHHLLPWLSGFVIIIVLHLPICPLTGLCDQGVAVESEVLRAYSTSPTLRPFE